MNNFNYLSLRNACTDLLLNSRASLTVEQTLILHKIAKGQEHLFLNNLKKRSIKNLAFLIDYLPVETGKKDYVDFLAAKCPQAIYEYCLKGEEESELTEQPNKQITLRLNRELAKPEYAKGLLDYYCAKNAKLSDRKLGLKIDPEALPKPVVNEYLTELDKKAKLKQFPKVYNFIKTIILSVFGYGSLYRVVCGGDEQLAKLLRAAPNSNTYKTLSPTLSNENMGSAQKLEHPFEETAYGSGGSVEFTPERVSHNDGFTPEHPEGGRQANDVCEIKPGRRSVTPVQKSPDNEAPFVSIVTPESLSVTPN